MAAADYALRVPETCAVGWSRHRSSQASTLRRNPLRRRTESVKTLSLVETDEPCPGRDCERTLRRRVWTADAGGPSRIQYECPVNPNHVTQQFVPPEER